MPHTHILYVQTFGRRSSLITEGVQQGSLVTAMNGFVTFRGGAPFNALIFRTPTSPGQDLTAFDSTGPFFAGPTSQERTL